jgi:hypothetical protein
MSTTTKLPIESIGELAARLPQAGTVDVTIEVIGDAIGDQIQVERLPWHALIYDDRDKGPGTVGWCAGKEPGHRVPS